MLSNSPQAQWLWMHDGSVRSWDRILSPSGGFCTLKTIDKAGHAACRQAIERHCIIIIFVNLRKSEFSLFGAVNATRPPNGWVSPIYNFPPWPPMYFPRIHENTRQYMPTLLLTYCVCTDVYCICTAVYQIVTYLYWSSCTVVMYQYMTSCTSTWFHV